MSHWRFLPISIADQQYHIEQSEQLLSTVSPSDVPTLSWSMAGSPGLVLGFSQKQSILNQEVIAVQHIPIYHRRAGGTAVLVGPHLLSLDLVLPANHPLVLPDVVESYRWFGEAWVKALGYQGISARTVLPGEAHQQRSLLKQEATRMREMLLHRACYGTISPYEVVLATSRQKIVGLDMIRRRSGTLLQAGVLLHWDTMVAIQAALLGHTPEEQTMLQAGLLERAVGLDTLLGQAIGAEKVITAFEAQCMSMQIS